MSSIEYQLSSGGSIVVHKCKKHGKFLISGSNVCKFGWHHCRKLTEMNMVKYSPYVLKCDMCGSLYKVTKTEKIIKSGCSLLRGCAFCWH